MKHAILFYGAMALGAQYHIRAYAFLIVGMMCLLVGLVRILVVSAAVGSLLLIDSF